jgi:hypothetical protein
MKNPFLSAQHLPWRAVPGSASKFLVGLRRSLVSSLSENSIRPHFYRKAAKIAKKTFRKTSRSSRLRAEDRAQTQHPRPVNLTSRGCLAEVGSVQIRPHELRSPPSMKMPVRSQASPDAGWAHDPHVGVLTPRRRIFRLVPLNERQIDRRARWRGDYGDRLLQRRGDKVAAGGVVESHCAKG